MWSRMKGLVARQYAETRMGNCLIPIPGNTGRNISLAWSYLLQQNSKPEIIKQMYITGQRKGKINDVAMMIREIGHTQNSIIYSSDTREVPSVTMPNNPLPLPAVAKLMTVKGKGRDVHATGTEQQGAPSQTNPVSGMDFKAMKAYFYDMHINELKAQGKGQSC
ncbi:hypothetical protein BS17DRAFT_770059 [Gyrodon lividus]|nr:hypothetical protein BS17DRAFT_770059 [Gyrodon lividus]